MHRNRHLFAFIVAAALLGSASCATTYPSPRERLMNRAAYDLECPAEALTVTRLDEETRAVEGCGHRATYVLICDGPVGNLGRRCTWLANTATLATSEWRITRAPIASP
jgi:hypothetical protein